MSDRLHRAARPFGLVAAVFLVAMMLLVVADVVLRHVFDISMVGTVDLVELCLAGSIAIAWPATFLRGEVIVVDVIDTVAGRRTQVVLRSLGTGLTLVFVAAIGANMVEPALDSIEFNDVTSTLSIPKYVHWAILGSGIFASAIALLWVIAGAVRRGRAPR